MACWLTQSIKRGFDMREFVVHAVGWASSLVLLATIIRQVHKQWREGASAGVSKWLFIGQSTASIGFSIYSWLLGIWVFLFTNLAMLGWAVVGQAIYMRNQRSNNAASAHS